MKPVIAPAEFPAASLIESAVAFVMVPAIMNGLEPTFAASSSSFIFFMSASVRVIGLSAIFPTEIPLVSIHSCLSASFMAFLSSFALPGI